jgi:hypothetical protein
MKKWSNHRHLGLVVDDEEEIKKLMFKGRKKVKKWQQL